jgi:hypothetical protein
MRSEGIRPFLAPLFVPPASLLLLLSYYVDKSCGLAVAFGSQQEHYYIKNAARAEQYHID